MAKDTLILIYGRKYWNEVLNLKNMVRWGTISQADFDNLQYADSVDEAFDKIRVGLEKYHMQGDPFLQAYCSILSSTASVFSTEKIVDSCSSRWPQVFTGLPVASSSPTLAFGRPWPSFLTSRRKSFSAAALSEKL